MESYIVLASFVLVPAVLVLLTRASAAILFFCVASAVLLERFIDRDAATAANALLPNTGVDYMALALLIIPVIITTFVFRKSIKPHMLPLHLLVAVLTGLTLSLVGSTFFPGSLVSSYEKSSIWQDISSFKTVIVGSGFLLSVVILSLSKPSHDRRKH